MKIVLFEPQIPQNAGNIVRTCSVTGTDLVLVTPLGFKTSDRYLKRAGLDYWDEVKIEFVSDLKSYLEKQEAPFYFFSSKSNAPYSDIQYSEDSILIFGSETSGLPDEYHTKWASQFYTIPMKANKRSFKFSE